MFGMASVISRFGAGRFTTPLSKRTAPSSPNNRKMPARNDLFVKIRCPNICSSLTVTLRKHYFEERTRSQVGRIEIELNHEVEDFRRPRFLKTCDPRCDVEGQGRQGCVGFLTRRLRSKA
jgi:hypothetical protein